MAAATGNCTVVHLDLDRMPDRTYRDALAASPALAACR
jgi:hypothetical protein